LYSVDGSEYKFREDATLSTRAKVDKNEKNNIVITRGLKHKQVLRRVEKILLASFLLSKALSFAF
jgi:hypothetical protein